MTPISFQDQLQQVSAMVDTMRANCTWKLKSINALILKYGRKYSVSKNTKLSSDTPKMCYQNAYKAACDNHDLLSCEGCVSFMGIPINHAWVVNKEGKAFEPTLKFKKGESLEYFGVTYTTQFIIEESLRSGHYGVFGDMLLPWQVEWLKNGSLPENALYQFK